MDSPIDTCCKCEQLFMDAADESEDESEDSDDSNWGRCIHISLKQSAHHSDPIEYYMDLSNQYSVDTIVCIDFNKYRTVYFDDKYDDFIDILGADKTHPLVMNQKLPLQLFWTSEKDTLSLTFAKSMFRNVIFENYETYRNLVSMVDAALDLRREQLVFTGQLAVFFPKKDEDIYNKQCWQAMANAKATYAYWCGSIDMNRMCITVSAENTLALFKIIEKIYSQYVVRYCFDADLSWCPLSKQPKKNWNENAVYHWPFNLSAIVDICLALNIESVYVLLFIIDWLPNMWLFSRIKKVRAIEKVLQSIARIRSTRSVRTKAIKIDN